MNINDILKSRHLKAFDLQGREPVVTIKGVRRVPLGKTREEKWVVDFIGKEKYLILNTTMIRALAVIAGDETDRWAGTVVQLFTTMENDVRTKQPVPVVRVKAPSRQPILVKAAGTR